MGTPGTSWRDIFVVVNNAAKTPGSAIASALDPRASWTTEAYLLAEIADSVRFLAWSKSKDAQRNRNRPKTVPRPGSSGTGTAIKSMTIDELAETLAKPRTELS